MIWQLYVTNEGMKREAKNCWCEKCVRKYLFHDEKADEKNSRANFIVVCIFSHVFFFFLTLVVFPTMLDFSSRSTMKVEWKVIKLYSL